MEHNSPILFSSISSPSFIIIESLILECGSYGAVDRCGGTDKVMQEHAQNSTRLKTLTNLSI